MTTEDLRDALRAADIPEPMLDVAIAQLSAAIASKRIDRLAETFVEHEGRPSFAEHLRLASDIAADPEASPVDLFEGLIEQGSTNGLIAPTNSGGSSFLVNVAHSLITGEPFLGTFKPTPAAYRVLYVNPEEAQSIPTDRLKMAGATDEQLARVLHLHARDRRLYLNRPDHVAAFIEDYAEAAARLWPDELGPLVVIIDGLQPTLSGSTYNEDLEAWKDGMGELRLALDPVAVFVRAQVTTAAARSSRKSGSEDGSVEGEDVAGGQFFQWPDNRLVLNRTNGDGRRIELRGRRTNREVSYRYSYSEATGLYRAEGVDKMVLAVLRVDSYLGGGGWQATEDHEARTSAKAVARHLADESKDLAALGEGESISRSTFERAIGKAGWRFDGKAWRRSK